MSTPEPPQPGQPNSSPGARSACSGSTATRGSRAEAVHLGMPPALLRTALIRRRLGLVVQLVAVCFLDYRLHRRADPDALADKVLDPLNASDLLLAVEAVPARRALRPHESVPVLPGA